MIQLNLLPDVKLEYLRAERQRRLVMVVSVLATGTALALLLILLSVSGLQKKHLNDLSSDIKRDSAKLQYEPQITKILTVQNQLESLGALHSAKPAVSRLFGFLNDVTPAKVDISTYSTDLAAHTMTITGSADALSSVNQYVDTLKFTTFKTEGGSDKAPAFSNIVLNSFGIGTASTVNSHVADYNITLAYDPILFDITKKVELVVPKQVTTRAKIDQPNDLFKAAPAKADPAGRN